MSDVLQAAWVTEHATIRMVERWGVSPTADQWRDAVLRIIAAVAGDPPQRVMRQQVRPSGIEWWIVELAGVTVPVVYSPEAARIVTVMESAAWSPRHHGHGQRRGILRRHERERAEVWE